MGQPHTPRDMLPPIVKPKYETDYTGNDPGDNSRNAPQPLSLEERAERLVRVHARDTGYGYHSPLRYFDTSLIEGIVEMAREGRA